MREDGGRIDQRTQTGFAAVLITGKYGEELLAIADAQEASAIQRSLLLLKKDDAFARCMSPTLSIPLFKQSNDKIVVPLLQDI
jgi:hypothetical protein